MEYIEVKAAHHRDFMISEINRLFEIVMSSLLSSYPKFEISTFDQQKTEADNMSGPTPIIDQIAIAKGVTREEVATRIRGKANVLAPYSGLYLAAKQVLIERIEKLGTEESLMFDYNKAWKDQVLLGFENLNKM